MESFDFIVVGAGASGCLLASRLAKALPEFTVLLVDAGGTNSDATYQTYGERHWTFLTAPGYNWGYQTIPQPHLAGRNIDASRGKGLGGSTNINFCVYTRGPRADYDRWADLVGDDTWKWINAQQRFNRIEKFHHPSSVYQPYIHASDNDHGFDGPLNVGVTETWDPSLGGFLDRLYEHYPKNLDHNSGNPLGVNLQQVSAVDGHRTTASEAFLSEKLPNLTIVTNAAAEKILFEGKRAVGVKLPSKTVSARNEVIVSCGTIDSPKLLLLSGVGPVEELQCHQIELVRELPGIGKNLSDRLFLFLIATQKHGTHNRTSFIDSPDALMEARKQWLKDGTGYLAGYYLPQMLCFFKSKGALESKEFEELDPSVQQALHADTKPTFEMIGQVPNPSAQKPEPYLGTVIGFQGSDGTGEIRLQSSNPSDHPVIDPKYLSRPFDRRLAIESVRESLDLLNIPSIAQDRVNYALGPGGRSDEEIFKFVQETATSMWHPCGTVKMGRPEDLGACVDTDFRLIGLEGIRVADMSIAPILPDAHLQAPAYLIGETAAEKIIAQYK